MWKRRSVQQSKASLIKGLSYICQSGHISMSLPVIHLQSYLILPLVYLRYGQSWARVSLKHAYFLGYSSEGKSRGGIPEVRAVVYTGRGLQTRVKLASNGYSPMLPWHMSERLAAALAWAKIDSETRMGCTDQQRPIKERLRLKLLRCARERDCKYSRHLVGCSSAFLRQHLARMFWAGMSWKNHGKWHIDHIKPCAKFNLSKPEQRRLCFHYLNLQPLWAPDNYAKRATWIEPL